MPLFPRHLVFLVLNLECIAEAFDRPLQRLEEDTWIVDWGGRHHRTCFVHVCPIAYVSNPKMQLETERTHPNNFDRSPLQHLLLICWHGISGDYSGSVWARRPLLSIVTLGLQVAFRFVDGILVLLVHVLGLCCMLVVPDLAIVWGFAPQNVAVSLVQYRAAGVPVESHAVWLLEFVLERCWIYTSLEVLLQFVSI